MSTPSESLITPWYQLTDFQLKVIFFIAICIVLVIMTGWPFVMFHCQPDEPIPNIPGLTHEELLQHKWSPTGFMAETRTPEEKKRVEEIIKKHYDVYTLM